LFPDVGSDYLPPLSVPDFVLTSVRRSCARHAAAAFPATILEKPLLNKRKLQFSYSITMQLALSAANINRDTFTRDKI
jgi:hypothetical protein